MLWVAMVIILVSPDLSCAMRSRVSEVIDPADFSNLTHAHLESQYRSEIVEVQQFTNLLMILGSNMDTLSTSNISDRYSCDNHKITFTRLASLKISLSITTYFSLDPECEVNFGDETTPETLQFKDKTQLTADHTYSQLGVYSIEFTCKETSGDKKDRQTETCPSKGTLCVTVSFDELFHDAETPMKVRTTDPLDIVSLVRQNIQVCGSPTFNWRILSVQKEESGGTGDPVFIPFVNFTQSGFTFLKVPALTLEPGLYIVELEVIHSATNSWNTDFLFVQIILPELIATISGGTVLQFPLGQMYVADASKSLDPTTGLTSIMSLPLTHQWNVVCFDEASSLEQTIDKYIVSFPEWLAPLELVPAVGYGIQAGDEYFLEFDTSRIGSSSKWCFIYFTLSRGDLVSTKLQVLHLVAGAIPVSLICVVNCNLGREMKISKEQIQFDSNTTSDVTSYQWTVEKWYISPSPDSPDYFSDVTSSIQLQSGTTTQSLGILENELEQGTTYRFKLTASTDQFTGSAAYVRTVSYVPYWGRCLLDKSSVTAMVDLFTMDCPDWRGVDERKQNDTSGSLDINPLLAFKIIQRTNESALPEEPIAFSKSRQFYILLKVGDHTQNYITTLLVRVFDMYNVYTEVNVSVQSNPAFNHMDVNGDQTGSDKVESFMSTEVNSSLELLVNLGMRDLQIFHASSAVSHFYPIALPIWVPPVPQSIHKDEGIVLDLNPSGQVTNGTLGNMLSDTLNVTIDPATISIQMAIERLTTRVYNILVDDVVNGPRREDKQFTSLITNSFTNMISKSNFVTANVKATLIKASAKLPDVMLASNEGKDGADDGPQIEVSSAELVEMYTSTVNAVVPDTLRDMALITDYESGRYQISARLAVDRSNISTEAATMSPEERAYLYFKMQKILEIEIDKARDTAESTAQSALTIARHIQNASKICNTCNNANRSATKQQIFKHNADVIAKQPIVTRDSVILLEGLASIDNNTLPENNNSVSVSIVNFDENIFMYDDNQLSSLVTSGVLHVDVKSTINNTYVTTGYVTYEQPVITPQPFLTIPALDPEDASQFSVHKFLYRSAADYVCMVIRPQRLGVKEYRVFLNVHGPPTLLDYLFMRHVRLEDDWQLCIPPTDMPRETGVIYLGVQIERWVTERPYYFTLITVACMVWEEDRKKWDSNKCDLTWLPDENKIRCQCRDVTDMTFGNTFYAAPNSIDFLSVFLKFSPLNQAAVLGTVSTIFTIYVIVVVWARRKDKDDFVRWGTTPLRDNLYTDSYFYFISVHTGLRRGAGTRSHIGFMLTGEKGDTGDRELFDGVRREFDRGSVMSFLMATNKHLGDLLHLALWHDNSGKGSMDSWYISKVVVKDISKDEIYTFMCEQWLSLGRSLQITALANPSSSKIPIENRFYDQAKNRLSEGHLWVSVAYRPISSSFSRVQRASVALSYLLLTMIGSAIYFNPDHNYEVPALITVGPFRFQLQQLYVSLMSTLISTPAVLVIAFLFKRSRRPDIYNTRLAPTLRTKTSSRHESDIGWKSKLQQNSIELEKALLTKGTPRFEGFYLPYVFQYVGWVLVGCATVVSSFFIVLYSMEWGKQKSEDWLSTFFLSVFESFFIVDPIMVLGVAMLFAIIFRSMKPEMEQTDQVNLVLTYRKMLRNQPIFIRDPPPRPLGGEDFETSVRRHQNQKYLLTALKNILINMFFMWIIFSIGFSNRDDRSYRLHKDIVNQLQAPKKLPQFTKIKTPGDLYLWLNYTVFPSLFPEKDINGFDLHWSLREFMSGFNCYRLGPPRLRQLRTKKGTCKVPGIGTVDCYGQYQMSTEDTTSTCIGWKNSTPCSPNEIALNYSSEAWKFTSALDVWGLPVPGFYTTYGGGGYIAQFSVNRNTSIEILNELYREIWLDRQTRSVIFEFTLFCGNVNMFVYNMFMVEFPESGGAFTSYSIYPFRLYQHEGPRGVYTLVCEVIFLLYFLFLLIKIGISFYQQRCRYFKQFWLVFELIQFAVGLSAIATYFIRLILTQSTIDNFKEDNKLFVNFYHIVFWDHLLVTLIGILVFMATVRILQIFGTSKRVRILVKIFSDCGWDLFWFGMNFIYIWLCFSVLAYLLFGSQLFAYWSIYRAMATLFTTTMGASRFREMNETDPVMAKVFFVLFIVVVVFYILTLFLSILSGSIDALTNELRHDNTEDLLDFMLAKLKQMFRTPNRVQPKSNVTQVQVAPATESPEVPVSPIPDLFILDIRSPSDLLTFEICWQCDMEFGAKEFKKISRIIRKALRRRGVHTPVYIDMSPTATGWNQISSLLH